MQIYLEKQTKMSIKANILCHIIIITTSNHKFIWCHWPAYLKLEFNYISMSHSGHADVNNYLSTHAQHTSFSDNALLGSLQQLLSGSTLPVYSLHCCTPTTTTSCQISSIEFVHLNHHFRNKMKQYYY